MTNNEIAFETLLEFVPNKEISRFKSLLSNRKTLDLIVNLNEVWTYLEDWDHITFDEKYKYCGYASDFKDRLSNNMYIYGDVVIFVEHKGPDGWCHPVVTVLSLSKGYVKFDYKREG